MLTPNQAGSTSGARKLIRTRPARLIALVLVTVAVSCVAGAFLFQATGSRKGYQTGYASVGYYESAAIADSMIADASNSTLRSAGLAPETGQHGAWYVARFELARAGKLCRYGATPVPDSVRVPTFSALARVPTGKSYNS